MKESGQTRATFHKRDVEPHFLDLFAMTVEMTFLIIGLYCGSLCVSKI